MIGMDDYLALDGLAMAELVRTGQVKASDLLEAAIARAEALNPTLNAITIPMFEEARGRVKALPSAAPLGGVPFLLKDLFQDYAGAPYTWGSMAYKRAGTVAERNSVIVDRWLAAGTVPFGRTNTPEFGSKGITEPATFGPTANPWDLARSPGGSSGGSAAAVAAGIVPLAGANDGGGSIRIPAASTGLFGFKPGRGRTPSGPDVAEALHGAAINHVLTRTVRDSAAMLDATHGPELGSMAVLAPPERPYLQEVGRDPGRLRIAFDHRSPVGTDVDPELAAATKQTAQDLESLGHHVEEATPHIDGAALASDFVTLWFANLAAMIEHAQTTLGASLSDFELDTVAVAMVGRKTSAMRYNQAYTNWLRYSRKLSEFYQRFDVYMTPTLGTKPPLIGERTTPAWAETAISALLPLGLAQLIPLAGGTVQEVVMNNLARVPFTQLANVTGTPAMSVPLHSYADGFPLGIQFCADQNSEGMLLRLAGQLEQAHPWIDRRPVLGQ